MILVEGAACNDMEPMGRTSDSRKAPEQWWLTMVLSGYGDNAQSFSCTSFHLHGRVTDIRLMELHGDGRRLEEDGRMTPGLGSGVCAWPRMDMLT